MPTDVPCLVPKPLFADWLPQDRSLHYALFRLFSFLGRPTETSLPPFRPQTHYYLHPIPSQEWHMKPHSFCFLYLRLSPSCFHLAHRGSLQMNRGARRGGETEDRARCYLSAPPREGSHSALHLRPSQSKSLLRLRRSIRNFLVKHPDRTVPERFPCPMPTSRQSMLVHLHHYWIRRIRSHFHHRRWKGGRQPCRHRNLSQPKFRRSVDSS
mmetsp:Transcript_24330/g.37639  ORF Transcript_24330/g.37639 Transcript_24330/m.37639 type:complete len:211 (+) Transcript_24330:1408-2040(+)